jgi:hypothetical protein
MKRKSYFNICLECGDKFGLARKQFMGMRPGTCDWCDKKDIWITSASDFGYPDPPIKEKEKKILNTKGTK